MGELTINEAALLLCILGTPTYSGRYYPTVEESLNYMMTGNMNKLPESHNELDKEEESLIQMEMFV